VTVGSGSWTPLITLLEGDSVMARIVEFLIPAAFKPKIKCVPQEEQGGLVVFPGNLKNQPKMGQVSI
jgi:hypothetical protein